MSEPPVERSPLAESPVDISDSSSGEMSDDLFFESIAPNSTVTPSLSPKGSMASLPKVVELEDDETVPEATWQRWEQRLEPTDLPVHNRIVTDETGDVSVCLLSPLGKGVSGSVYAVKVIKCEGYEGLVLAMKVFRTDPSAVSQGNNEVLILQYLNRVVGKKDRVAIPDMIKVFQVQGHVAFLMELGGPNLFQIIGVRNYVGLTLPNIRGILTRLLDALAILEARGVVHADVKPENILVSMRRFGQMRSMAEYTAHLSMIVEQFQNEEATDMDVILVDWSSASIGYSQKAPYIQSRFYRAPEVLMRGKYGPSVDMWSLGCVAAELFLASPLFPGGDELDMLRQIQLKLGIMPRSVTRKIGEDSPARHSNEWKLDQSMYSPGNFELFLRERSGRDDFDFLAFVNILRLMLQLNCDARITASSGILHPFITGSVQQQPRRAISRRDSMMEDSASSHSGAITKVTQRRSSRRYSSRRKALEDDLPEAKRK